MSDWALLIQQVISTLIRLPLPSRRWVKFTCIDYLIWSITSNLVKINRQCFHGLWIIGPIQQAGHFRFDFYLLLLLLPLAFINSVFSYCQSRGCKADWSSLTQNLNWTAIENRQKSIGETKMLQNNLQNFLLIKKRFTVRWINSVSKINRVEIQLLNQLQQ